MTASDTQIGVERRGPFTSTRTEPTLPAEAPRLFAPRRRQARFRVRGLEALSPVFGCAIEASAGGLQLESSTPLVPGAGYVFRLASRGRFLDLRGRVVWSRLDRFEAAAQGARAVFQAGIRLDAGAERAWRSALARLKVTVGI